MPEPVSPHAGKHLKASMLVDVPRLVTAYFTRRPDPANRAERIAFGTSGHRGSAFHSSFNEAHILATTQAICLYRRLKGIDGPLFIGKDTHALSEPAFVSAVEVLAGNEAKAAIAHDGGYTPTPAVSHAILLHNNGRSTGLADGIVITPSHNPPEDGGFKYNPPSGGPADVDATKWIEQKANEILAAGLEGVLRVPYERALKSPSISRHDYVSAYAADIGEVVDMAAIRASGLKIGIDPLGGAAVNFWAPIIERYGLSATLVNDAVDPTFRFMTADRDGKIRMDCSSPYAMAGLIGMSERFDVAFATDTDADRHGIVTRSGGLMNPNHYLTAAIAYLFANRPRWGAGCGIGKTIVSSSSIDRIAEKLGRKLLEVPVGFKWFVEGLIEGSLGFVGEESAGATLLRQDGSAWTTDKDGLALGLLAAEITARTGKDPSLLYESLTEEVGTFFYERIDVPATKAEKDILGKLSPEQLKSRELAGEPIEKVLSRASGNDQPFGGIKVMAKSGWFAARPSGTEDVYKVYAESFRSDAHLRDIQAEAQRIVAAAFAGQGTG
jgi:phosphoglucomutase